MRSTDYVRETCFDAVPSEGPLPEIRLVARGQDPMVVERKIIQWPEHFLYRHSHWHHLADFLARAFSSICTESMTVAINSERLEGLNKQQVDQVVELIVQQVRVGRQAGEVTSAGGQTMPWRIRDGLFSAPEGTRIEVLDLPANGWPSELKELPKLREAQLAGFRSELKGRLGDVERKFAEFSDHYRVLLLQFVGESCALFEETDVAAIVKAAHEAAFIDEVWIASKEWISMDDFKIGWVPAPTST